MDMLLKTHGDGGAELPDDDPQTSYLISAWSRICKVSCYIFLFIKPGHMSKKKSLKNE